MKRDSCRVDFLGISASSTNFLVPDVQPVAAAMASRSPKLSARSGTFLETPCDPQCVRTNLPEKDAVRVIFAILKI